MKCFYSALLLVYSITLNAETVKPIFPASFNAVYELEKNGFSVAETKYSFQTKPITKFQSSTQLTGVAALFSNEEIIESSTFTMTTPSSIQLTQYQFKQTGETHKTINSSIDWQHQTINTIINKQAIATVKFTTTVWDKNSAFIALIMLANEQKETITFNALDEGKLAEYKFNFIGTKEIELYDDEWKNASIWQRKKLNKTLTFYLDPANKNMPLKIEEHRNQTLRATLWLKELNWYE